MLVRTASIVYTASVLVVMGLATPRTAAADTVAAAAHLRRSTVSVDAPVMARVNVHEKFSSVDSVCFEFTFENDLLDPGDFLQISPLALGPPHSGPGFENGGDAPQATRTLCLVAEFQPEFVALFTDGKEKQIELEMEVGSVQIASLMVVVAGTPANACH
jgi:hypothetical protein